MSNVSNPATLMENLRGSLLMVAAMGLFALEDMLIKLTAGTVSVGQILLMLGGGGGMLFALIALARGEAPFTRDLGHPGVMARNLTEMVGTFGFVTAIALIPISTASTILQATPLVVTMGAALLLGEAVGWRRWSAIAVGFAGVILVLRPGTEGFSPLALYAVLGVAGLALRDIATRYVPPRVSSLQLATWGFLSLVPLGAGLIAFGGHAFGLPAGPDLARLGLALFVGTLAYFLLILATRMGDVSVIAPFRYTRIVYALIIGILVFDENPDALTLTGAAVIVASGIYTLLREARLRRARHRAAAALQTGTR